MKYQFNISRKTSNMQLCLVMTAALVSAVTAAPPYYDNPDAAAKILRYDNNNYGVRGYNYFVQTSNGINFEEEGQFQNVGTEDQSLEVRGQYEYIGSDGNVYLVTYTAGRDGFQPRGPIRSNKSVF